MKTIRLLLSSVILISILAACGTPAPTATATIAPSSAVPSPTAPSATPRPSAWLTEDTELFAGPGNIDYGRVADLAASTVVYPLGLFKDFVKVDAVVNGAQQTGYIHRTALDGLSAGLPELQAGDVPLVSLDTVTTFYDPKASYSDAGLTINNDTGNYWGTLQESFQVAAGLTLTFKLSTNNSQYGAIQFTDKAPNGPSLPYWKGIHQMVVYIQPNSNDWIIEFRDGIAESHDHGFGLGVTGDRAVSIRFADTTGKVILVTDKDTGRIYKKIDTSAFTSVLFPNGLFPDGHMNLSLVAAPQTALTISDFSATKPPSGAWINVGQRLPILSLAHGLGISLSNDIDMTDMRNPTAVEVLTSNFNMVTLPDFEWRGFWLGPDREDFAGLDLVVNWSLQHGQQVIASPVIRGDPSDIPDWLAHGNFSRQQLIDIMQKHIETLMTHFKGRVRYWSIVNEVVDRGCRPNADFWCVHIGMDYPELALRAAREADPNAILIYSENWNECPATTHTKYVVDNQYKLVQDLKSKGVPLDVVAMQMHLFMFGDTNPRPPSKECVVDTMKKFASLGVSIYITEMDVNLNGLGGTQDQRFQFQAQVYHDMVAACVESGVCKNIGIWGLSDANTGLNCPDPWCYQFPKADPLLFDKSYLPKPAYQAVFEALSGK